MPVWCHDAAGPSQAIPPPGPSWQPEGHPASQPDEYLRGGTAKLLTLFRPATGEVRAAPVRSAPTTVLHPWLMAALAAIRAACPPGPDPPVPGTRGIDWRLPDHTPILPLAAVPPLPLLLVWDHLAGDQTATMGQWCLAHGSVPL